MKHTLITVLALSMGTVMLLYGGAVEETAQE